MNSSIKKKIHKIMDLCLEAKTRGHDCFLSYSGHVDSLRIHIHLFGWNSEIDPDYESSIYLTYKNTVTELDKVIVYLKEIINTDYERSVKLNYFNRNFNSIMNCDTDYRDQKLSKLLTNIESEFSIPAYKDEKYNEENPDVMKLYRNISNERSIIKALKVQGD